MNVIRIPSSNIYSKLDSLVVTNLQNKISLATVDTKKFDRDTQNISKQYTATYYLWDERPFSLPSLVAEDSTINTFRFQTVALTDLGKHKSGTGVISPLGATVELLKDKLINLNLPPFSNGYINAISEGFQVVRTQQWLHADSEIEYKEDNSESYHWVTSLNTKIVRHSPQMFYNHNDNTFNFSLDLKDSYYRDDSGNTTKKTTMIRLSDSNEKGGQYGTIVDSFDFLLSETIELAGLCYISSEDSTKISGYESMFSFALPTNELMQDGATLYDEELSQVLLNNVIKKYQFGKEVYTIRCSISNYSYLDGNKAISLDDNRFPATFDKHDIVEPYVFSYRGEVPLSSYSNGMPKRFEVIGVDFVDNGVVWQELTLQEQPYEQFVEVILDPNKASITLFEGEYYRSFVINGIDGLTDAVNSIVSNDNGTLTINYRTSEEVRILVYYTV